MTCIVSIFQIFKFPSISPEATKNPFEEKATAEVSFECPSKILVFSKGFLKKKFIFYLKNFTSKFLMMIKDFEQYPINFPQELMAMQDEKSLSVFGKDARKVLLLFLLFDSIY